MLLRPRFFSLRPRRQTISLRRRRRRRRRGPGLAHSAASSLSWFLLSLSPIWRRRVLWRAPTRFTTTTAPPHVALACTASACVRITSSTTPRETSGDSSDEEADEDAANENRLRRKMTPAAKSQPSDTCHAANSRAARTSGARVHGGGRARRMGDAGHDRHLGVLHRGVQEAITLVSIVVRRR